jgi:glycosyltransferase involved in cell wall biosynthesis
MKTPVGLGMTCYNRDRYLSAAIESVVRQTYSDWRLTILDDGSDDGSFAIAQEWAAKDGRITAIQNRENRGAGYALCRSLKILDCDYLGWVDSDDLLHPEALQKTVAHLINRPQCDLVYTHYNSMNSDGHDKGLGVRCSIPYSPQGLLTNFMVFHFRLMRSAAYWSIGGIDPTLPAAIDYDFILRFSEQFAIECLPESLYFYRQHNQSLSVGSRQDQTNQSVFAIERALVRRGLDEKLKLSIATRLKLVEVAS